MSISFFFCLFPQRDLESSARLDQSGQRNDEQAPCSADSTSQGDKSRKSSMMAYRECSSSPVSVGSSTTTRGTTASSSSSSGIHLGFSARPDDRPASSLPNRPRQIQKAATNKRAPLHTPISRPSSPRHPHPHLNQSKPLSKRTLRLARRNQHAPLSNGSSQQSSIPFDSVGLLKELKV